jgi:hypothetical protein
VQQQHLQRALLLGLPFLPRFYTHEIRGFRAFATLVGNVSEGVGARREQHLADPAETGTTNGQQPQARHRTEVAVADRTVRIIMGPSEGRGGQRDDVYCEV